MRIANLNFKKYLSKEVLEARIRQLGKSISKDYKGQDLVLVSILKGSFIFTADLVRNIDLPVELEFIQLSSYQGTESSGSVQEKIPFEKDVSGRNVILIDDILDTGLTISYLHDKIAGLNPSSIEIASLLMKPAVFKDKLDVKYLGFEVPNLFLVGYGLDLDGIGRNLPDLYVRDS